jgi:hypothetical protein
LEAQSSSARNDSANFTHSDFIHVLFNFPHLLCGWRQFTSFSSPLHLQHLPHGIWLDEAIFPINSIITVCCQNSWLLYSPTNRKPLPLSSAVTCLVNHASTSFFHTPHYDTYTHLIW